MVAVAGSTSSSVSDGGLVAVAGSTSRLVAGSTARPVADGGLVHLWQAAWLDLLHG